MPELDKIWRNRRGIMQKYESSLCLVRDLVHSVAINGGKSMRCGQSKIIKY